MIDVLPTNLKQRLVMLTAQPEKKTEKTVEQPSASASGHRPQWGTDLPLCATGWAMAHCLEPSLGVKETGPGPQTSHHRASGRKVMDMEGYGRSLSRIFSLKLERTSRTTVRRHDTKSCTTCTAGDVFNQVWLKVHLFIDTSSAADESWQKVIGRTSSKRQSESRIGNAL